MSAHVRGRTISKSSPAPNPQPAAWPRQVQKRRILIRIRFKKPHLPMVVQRSHWYRAWLRAFSLFRQYFSTTRRRIILAATVAVLVVSFNAPFIQNILDHKAYALSEAEAAVLSPTSAAMANELSYDGAKGVYDFNKNYKPVDPRTNKGAGGPLIIAKIYQDPTKGVQVTDPLNKIDFSLKPLFQVGSGKQQQNRIVFPAFNGGGHLIYTAQAVGVKQDVTLQQYSKDKLSYDYQLELGDQFAARLEQDGSVGIYGSSLPLNGNVGTGSEKDAALLKKARQKASKDKLLFNLPAPIIRETGGHTSGARAHFVLKEDKLTVVVEHLKGASYPLTIDPTVTALSATQFYFDANLETNVSVDTTNNLFERSPLTGGNLLAWNASSSTAAAHFLGAAAVYGGTLYVIGGASTTTTTNLTGSNYVEQAKINSDGSVGTFSAGNATGLPAGGISRFQLLSYNGYLYIIDGSTTDTTGASISNAIYYTRVTSESFNAYANGSQLANWSNTTTNVPTSARYDYAAAVANGVLYIAGGRTGTGYTSGLVTDVSYAPILPSGAPGSWTSTTALPAGRFGTDMQIYNGHIYIIGGNLGGGAAGGTLTATVLYASIASNGSIADSSWKSANSLVSSDGTTSQAIENLGDQFSMIYNGYLYATGGCTAVNSSQSCTAVASYTQLAQVNADGSLGSWFPNDFPSTGTTSLARTGTPTVGYNGAIYSVAGCSAMNAGSVSCSTTSLTSNYSIVNTTVGDISANRNPTALPVSLYGHATVVLNGFVYVLGGCLTNSCNGNRAANYTTYYNAINADGSLASTPWNTNTVATNATALGFDKNSGDSDCSTGGTDQCGLGGLAAATYNGYIYVVGGNTGAAYSNAVYYMQPDVSTGAPAAWTKSANTINTAVAELGSFAHNGALYIFGGCSGSTGIGCVNYATQVQKATIGAAGAINAFSTTGGGTQLQLSQGIAAFGLAFYGNFIYMAGGADSTNGQEAFIRRAKLDSSGNVVAATGATWANTGGSMSKARRRTVAQVVNGYLYIIGGHNAADTTGGANGTTYGDIQIGKIDLSTGGTGDIASFTQSSTSTLTARWNPAVAFGNGFMYVTGGCTAGFPPANCTSNTNPGGADTNNESFVVYNANSLGANTWNTPSHTYSSTSPDPAQSNRLGAAATVYNGYLYVAGGCTTFTVATLVCSAVTNTTAYAPINADGTLGTWTAGPTITTGTAFAQLAANNGFLYYIGGQTGGIATAVTTVYKSTIGAAGAPGSFSTSGQTALTAARTQASSAVYAGFIFIAGGYSGSANVNTVYRSTINGSGDITAWTATTSAFTTARRELSLVTAGAYLFVVGGYDGTNYYADVQVATPSTSTGDITSWSFNKEIPYKQAGMSAVGSNGYIYVFGGRSGVASTSCSNEVYFAPVNGNGTVGDWQQAPNTLASARFGTVAAYSNGYFYVNGGNDCTNILSSNVIQQSGQLSEAMHATYSRYVDFGTDATFRQLYVLGTNAAISGNDIDRWKIVVKTSTDANNSWGQKTNFTLNNFGYSNPITFQALDGSGVNQGASRYWQITFDIDQSQSFGFPDSSQPTITKYDFYFSPGPAKRLRDGKTFINETQTTLDAHP